MAIPKNAVNKTADAVQEESTEIENVAGEQTPSFDTGEDKSKTEAANEPAVKAAPTGVATTTAKESSLPSITNRHAMGLSESSREVQFADDDDDDLGGLVIDSYSFPVITQKDGMFKIGDEILGPDFECIIQSTSARFLYKDSAEADDAKEPKLAYSLDNPGPDAKDSSGQLISEITDEWIKGGVKKENIEMTRYLDIKSQLVGGDYDGSFATIQVPKTSIAKVSGKIVELRATGKASSMRFAVLNFSAPKSVGTGTRKFFPFLVRFVRKVGE